MLESLETFERQYSLNFTNKDLLRQAFIHNSYLNEHQGEQLLDSGSLEWLGDAVIELAVSEYLLSKYRDQRDKQDTSRQALVRNKRLAEAAKDLGLPRFLLLSKGEEETGGRSKAKILADTYEALVGALFLDKGYRRAFLFVRRSLLKTMAEVASSAR